MYEDKCVIQLRSTLIVNEIFYLIILTVVQCLLYPGVLTWVMVLLPHTLRQLIIQTLFISAALHPAQWDTAL